MKNRIIYNLMAICCVLLVLPFILLMFLEISSKGFIVSFSVFSFVMISIIMWIIAFIKKRIIKPISLLTEQTKYISSGDLESPIIYNKEDEIGEFIKAFDDMRAKLYEQQKMHQQFEIERKNFISSISHDLKTPISSISAYVEALQDEMAATPEEQQEYLSVIQSKLEILTELSNQLSFSYANPNDIYLNLEKVNGYDWSKKFQDNFVAECKVKNQDIKFVNQIEKNDGVSIIIDTCQLDRALQNILSNSLRYTKDYLLVSISKSNDNVVIVIANDGVQMKEKDVEKIFERFYTQETINENGHLGLGLYIAKTIIEAMKGTIKVKRKDNIISFEISFTINKN